ncbi:hypothetical protein D5H75_10115 [Bailinhaonella thermotolerans]|uniref:Uncharacterized protein n=2 Tax=Bailinhaonella thermotolerans TaxID=1070861 RepID=A0A3A4B0Y1_9ACTN|nr:hypothetical protein D5H75_10115 [Bailinhaonella thermotolerans]
MAVPGLATFTGYLRGAGWDLEDDDGRTTLWRPGPDAQDQQIRVVLPASENVRDYAERINEAIRAVAYLEERLPDEVVSDIRFGGADNVSVRLTPDAPPGEAPLLLAHAAISALRSYVIASAAALDNEVLVLPSRLPQRAESYAARTRVSAHPGSFVLSLALPLAESGTDEFGDALADQIPLLDVPSQPFGRKVASRMLAVAETAKRLADDVSDGRKPISSFGHPDESNANATELEALSLLGGPDRDAYQIRFSQSPLARGAQEPRGLRITPGQQRILSEAADFLRTRKSRPAVTVTGLVVRLFREGKLGPGEAVIQGVDDDTGQARRVRIELGEADYTMALRAHESGLQVTATGDLEIRGTRRSLRHLTSFYVIPGLGDD